MNPKQSNTTCNKRIAKEVAEEQNVSLMIVEHAVHHYGEFIATTIRSGGMEGVFIPYLGKIMVKHGEQQFKDYYHSLGPVDKAVLKGLTQTELNQLFAAEGGEA